MHYFIAARNFIFPRKGDLTIPDSALVFWILMIALVYQAVLCAIHTNVHTISMAGVGLTEGRYLPRLYRGIK